MIKKAIKAILFDKDGTLIDFNHTWHPVFIKFVEALSQKGSIEADTKLELMHALGGDETEFLPVSPFANAPFEEILGIIGGFIPGYGSDDIKATFEDIFAAHTLNAIPIGTAAHTLGELKRRGYVLGVATADKKETTEITLVGAGLLAYFDFIGTEDLVAAGKPAPDLMERFCKDQGLAAKQVAMVGDTIRDMQFACNAGAGQAIFVRSSFPDPAAEALADTILEDINALLSNKNLTDI